MVGADLRKKLFIGGAIVVLVAGFFFVRARQKPLDIDSPYMKSVHEVSEESRPPGVTNPYSYDLKDQAIAISESDKCKGCHGDMLEKVEGEPKYPIHFVMLRPITAKNSKSGVLDLECVHCHKKVDLGKRNRDKVTIRVDRRQCTTCHESTDRENAQAKDKGLDAIGKGNLIANHGTDKETGKGWLVEHRKVAGVVGAVECRRCHAFGSELDFCNECHEGWHGENWKGRHFKAARRLGLARCRQCHAPKSEMDFCSDRCHGMTPLFREY